MGTNYNIATGGFGCGTQTNIRGLENNKAITTILDLVVTEDIVEPDVRNVNGGSVNLTVDGGTKPYSVIWSDGKVGLERDKMTYGTYKYTVTDYNGDMSLEGLIVFEEEEVVEENVITETIIENVSREPIVYDSLCLTDGKTNYSFEHVSGEGMKWLSKQNNFVLEFNHLNNRWEISNWVEGNMIKNNGVDNKIPIGSDWNSNGKLWKLYKGICGEIQDHITLTINNETCYGLKNGSVYIKTNNPNKDYQYRIKGVSPYPQYQNDNIFKNLSSGSYIVEAKHNDNVITKEFSIDYDKEKKFVDLYLNKKTTSGDNSNRSVIYEISTDYNLNNELEVDVYLDIIHTKEFNCPNDENGCLINPIFNLVGDDINFDIDNTFTKESCENKTIVNVIKSKGSKKITLNTNTGIYHDELIHGIGTFDHTWADCNCKAYVKSKIEVIISDVKINESECFEFTKNGSLNDDIYIKDCIKQ